MGGLVIKMHPNKHNNNSIIYWKPNSSCHSKKAITPDITVDSYLKINASPIDTYWRAYQNTILDEKPIITRIISTIKIFFFLTSNFCLLKISKL